MLTTTMAMVGDFDVGDYDSALGLAMFLVFLFLVIIVMFNVLIALVSELYMQVMETAEVEVRKLRARTIMDAQALMSKAAKRNEAHFPQFLEVLQPHVAPPPSEVGKLRAEMESKVESVRVSVESKVESVEINLQSKVQSVESKVDSAVSKMDAVAGDVAKIMQLLQPE